MKKRSIVIVICLILVVLLFLPSSSTHHVSGSADILSPDKQKMGEAELSIEIKEQRRLISGRSKSFTFILDGRSFSQFETTTHAETDDGLCLISQMLYDEAADYMMLCSLTYPEDFSYAVLRADYALFYLNNGADIQYSELPLS